MVIFAQIFSKQALKDTIFFNFQKRPNGQIILFLANSFKKGQMATLFFSPNLWNLGFIFQDYASFEASYGKFGILNLATLDN